MKDTRNENASRLTPEKHDVPALFHAAEAREYVIAGAAGSWVVGQSLATSFEIVEVSERLTCAPCAQGVSADIHQVGFGKAG